MADLSQSMRHLYSNVIQVRIAVDRVRREAVITRLKGNDEIVLSPGDIFSIKTPGGGGFGKKVA